MSQLYWCSLLLLSSEPWHYQNCYDCKKTDVWYHYRWYTVATDYLILNAFINVTCIKGKKDQGKEKTREQIIYNFCGLKPAGH